MCILLHDLMALLYMHRELRAPPGGVAWNASMERSHWQISLREGQAPPACQDDLWRPDQESIDTTEMASQPPWNTGSALPLEAVSLADKESQACYHGICGKADMHHDSQTRWQTACVHALLLCVGSIVRSGSTLPCILLTRMTALQDRQVPSSVEQPASFAGRAHTNGDSTAEEQALWSQTVLDPFVSTSRRLLERWAAFLECMRIGCCHALHATQQAERLRQLLKAELLPRYICVASKEDYRQNLLAVLGQCC